MVGWSLFCGKNETDVWLWLLRGGGQVRSPSSVWWKAGLRACGHSVVRHHREHREAVIPAPEERALSPGDSPKTISVQEVSETHFLVSSFQGFVLVDGKFPIITQGLTSFPDSGVPESLPRPGG